MIAIYICNGSDVVNRTSAVPIYVLCFVLDKGQYFNLEFCLYPILFPNKETDRQRRVKHFINTMHCVNVISFVATVVAV